MHKEVSSMDIYNQKIDLLGSKIANLQYVNVVFITPFEVL